MADFASGDWASGDWSTGGGDVTVSLLTLLGVGCVGFVAVVLPTWYLTEGM
jgi:hypothetical protein